MSPGTPAVTDVCPSPDTYRRTEDNDTRWCSAISGSPLPEWTDFEPRSLQL